MIKNPDTIAILVSLYGDSPYLKDFLDSLARQSHSAFRLLYRYDSVPSEATRALVDSCPFAEKIDEAPGMGLPDTYWKLLLAATDFRYLMFADQDDVWHPDKVERSLAEIRKMEARFGSDVPLLVHSDLRVVDAEGKPLCHSFFRYQSLEPRRSSLKDLMVQNNITGCTMFFNRALADCMRSPVPAICHDWYLALIASAFGRIGTIEEPLTDYRQHDRNHYGAVPVKFLLTHIPRRKELRERLRLTQKQALLLREEFRPRLSPDQIRILEAWGGLLTERSFFRRLAVLIRNKFRKNDWIRTLGMWWAI